MASSNRDHVGRALELLAAGLEPFVERQMLTANGPDWVRSFLGPGQRVPREGALRDPALQLKVMTEAWDSAFRSHLSRSDRTLVFELRDTRNRWAHNEPFDADDAYRAVDSVERLLVSIDARELAEVRQSKAELRRMMYESEAPATPVVAPGAAGPVPSPPAPAVAGGPGMATGAAFPATVGTRVGLVGCVKSKREHPAPARDMYTSTMFQGRRRAVEATCDRWFVLSAKHGLLDPEQVIEPYDVALKALPPGAQQAWSAKVLAALRERLGDLSGVVFEIHAGAAYRDNGVAAGLVAAGATVENPTRGMNFGQQLAFYGSRTRHSVDRAGTGRPSAGYGLIGEVLDDSDEDSVAFFFADLEKVLGRPLPNSARTYRPWWANTQRSPQGRGWLEFGWKVARVELDVGVVQFDRQSRATTPPGRSAASPSPVIQQPKANNLPSLNRLRLEDVRAIPPFAFRWPDATENFDRAWEANVEIDRAPHRLRHGIGERVVFGVPRPHSVTFLDGQPAVEATAEDAYPRTRRLVSLIKGSDGRDVRELGDLPSGYEVFDIVRQADAIDAPYVRSSLVVRLAEDDLEGWARHAVLRIALRRLRAVPTSAPRVSLPQLEPLRTNVPDRGAMDAQLVEALLEYGAVLAQRDPREPVRFTLNEEANRFLTCNPFAFLVAVICDQGIKAERAWLAPWELRQRLGHLDPHRISAQPARVRAAFQQRPMLHRLVNVVPGWIVDASKRVVDECDGDAGRIWSDNPSAVALQARLCTFKGISQKKAAMAVEILERDLGVPISDLAGSDVAYDIHVRRVFLRTGLAKADTVPEIVESARSFNPDRPGSLDFPAWDIGRRWCRPADPRCDDCVLTAACPRYVDRADEVRGM